MQNRGQLGMQPVSTKALICFTLATCLGFSLISVAVFRNVVVLPTRDELEKIKENGDLSGLWNQAYNLLEAIGFHWLLGWYNPTNPDLNWMWGVLMVLIDVMVVLGVYITTIFREIAYVVLRPDIVQCVWMILGAFFLHIVVLSNQIAKSRCQMRPYFVTCMAFACMVIQVVFGYYLQACYNNLYPHTIWCHGYNNFNQPRLQTLVSVVDCVVMVAYLYLKTMAQWQSKHDIDSMRMTVAAPLSVWQVRNNNTDDWWNNPWSYDYWWVGLVFEGQMLFFCLARGLAPMSWGYGVFTREYEPYVFCLVVYCVVAWRWYLYDHQRNNVFVMRAILWPLPLCYRVGVAILTVLLFVCVLCIDGTVIMIFTVWLEVLPVTLNLIVGICTLVVGGRRYTAPHVYQGGVQMGMLDYNIGCGVGMMQMCYREVRRYLEW